MAIGTPSWSSVLSTVSAPWSVQTVVPSTIWTIYPGQLTVPGFGFGQGGFGQGGFGGNPSTQSGGISDPVWTKWTTD